MKEKMQEVFNTVREHLLKQMAKAYSTNRGICLYLDESGRKCAVGCLIKPEHYNLFLEGCSIGAIIDQPEEGWSIKLKKAIVDSLGYEPDEKMWKMMRSLQLAHDENDPQYWGDKLHLVALDYGLTY